MTLSLGPPRARDFQIPSQSKGTLTSVMMSLAKSLARSGVTKQDRPVRATPVSYWLGLLRSCKGGKRVGAGAKHASPGPPRPCQAEE